MSRVLAAAAGAGAGGQAEAERAIARELAAFAGASSALLLAADENPTEAVIADALTAELAIRLDGAEAHRLTSAVGLESEPAALLLPLRAPNQSSALVRGGRAVRALPVAAGGAGAALRGAAGGALGQIARLGRGGRGAARHSALARAAKALNESLDLSRV